MAKRKTLFDDRPVEINELTYVIKQDLSSLNSQISSLQSLSKSQQSNAMRTGEQEGEHNKNVSRQLPQHFDARIYASVGCRSSSGQTCGCRSKFQGSPGSPHQKSSSISITNRKFRLISLSTFATFFQFSAICLSVIQHPDKVKDAPTWLSKFESRHIEPGPFIFLGVDAEWPPVGPAATYDGRSPTGKYVCKYARRGYRYD